MSSSTLKDTTNSDFKYQGKGLLQFTLRYLPLLIILLAAIIVRFHHLDEQSLGLDELGEATTVNNSFDRFFNVVRGDAAAAPLDYLGVKLIVTFVGNTVLTVRLWAFLFGCFSILMIYVVGSSLFKSRRVGLLSSFLLAFSAFHLYYSQEARFYSLTVFVALLNLYLFNRALTTNTRKSWTYFGLVVALALYTHYFLVLLLLAEAVFLALYLGGGWKRSKYNPQVLKAGLKQVGSGALSMLAGLLLFIPWLFYATLTQVHNYSYGALPNLNFSQVLQSFSTLLTLNTDDKLMWLVLILAIAGTVGNLLSGKFIALMLTAVIIIAIPAAYVADQLNHYIWLERQVIFILPMLYLLAACGFFYLIDLISRLAKVSQISRLFPQLKYPKSQIITTLCLSSVFCIVWLLLSWTTIRKVYADNYLIKEDWRSVTNYITANADSNAHFYTALGPHDNFGLGYYNPALLGRVSDICFNPKTKFSDDDWVILFTDSGGQQCSGERMHNYFVQSGWGYKELAGLRIYSSHLHLEEKEAVTLPTGGFTLSPDIANGHYYLPLQLFSKQQYSLKFNYNSGLKPYRLVVQVQFYNAKQQLIHEYPPYGWIDVATFNSGSFKNPSHFAVTFWVPPETDKTWIVISNYADGTSQVEDLTLQKQNWDVTPAK